MAGNVNFAYRLVANPGASPAMNGVMSVGRPGLPSSMQRYISHQLRPRNLHGLGISAADVIANQQAQANSPFVTPAMLANQAAVVQNECAVDPSSPACQAATATGDIYTGGSPAADTAYILGQYCKQNLFNVQNFGDPADSSCVGGVPSASVIAAANAVGYTPAQIAAQNAYAVQTGTVVGSANISSGGGSGTQGGGPVLTVTAKPTPPPPPPTTQTMPNVQTANTTGTSGSASGSLLNGQPVSGAATTTTPTDYMPYILAAAAVVVLIMVSK